VAVNDAPAALKKSQFSKVAYPAVGVPVFKNLQSLKIGESSAEKDTEFPDAITTFSAFM
jgi:hypothetical protein